MQADGDRKCGRTSWAATFNQHDKLFKTQEGKEAVREGAMPNLGGSGAAGRQEGAMPSVRTQEPSR